MHLALILLLATIAPRHYRYHAANGAWVRHPHVYKRHPNTGTPWSGTCRDGAINFAVTHQGACSHHGGVQSWR